MEPFLFTRARIASGLLIALAPFARATDQPPADTSFTVRHYLTLEQVAGPQISPDGRTIVYTRSGVDQIHDRCESALWVMNADGSKQRFLAKGTSPVWSPDGTRIAYLAEAESPKGTQIFVRWMDAEGATSQATRLTEAPSSVHWSPDGKRLGFVARVPKKTEWLLERLPAAPAGATWTATPRVVDRLHYRTDGTGFLEAGFQHVFVVPAEGGVPRQVTAGDWSVGAVFDGLAGAADWSWSPDGRTIFVNGLAEGDVDRTLQGSNIYAIDVATGERRRLTPEPGNWDHPVVSPDGQLLAFTGHRRVTVAAGTPDLWVMRVDGSGLRNISQGLDRGVSEPLIWARDGRGVYFAPEDRGSQNIAFAPIDGRGVRAVTTGTQVVSLGSMAHNGEIVGVQTTFQAPGQVVRIAARGVGASVTPLTHINEDTLAGLKLATAEEVWYTSASGTRIQGWIVKPPGFDASRKYPLLLEIHGGPQGMYSVGFDPWWQVFASAGYVVLYTNPRGSTGYGDAFMAAIEKDWPGPEHEDLMAGVDTVLQRGYVDPTRLYVSGCSGGGTIASWVIGHTQRFAAAAVRCPITDWVSMAGISDIPLFAHSYFDKPFWEDPSRWLAKSPLMYAGAITTPTLIMSGTQDLRTPTSQAEELYAALKMRRVDTTLLLFEGEWHGTESLPSNWMRTALYMMEWFERHPGK